MNTISSQLSALADHFSLRRQAVLDAWHELVTSSPKQPTASALPRTQFDDHVPQILDNWIRILRALPDDLDTSEANAQVHDQEAKHGVQRWQQGYRLTELLREWGQLHLVLARELAAFTAAQPGGAPTVQSLASRELIKLINEGVVTSASRYAQLERAEAGSRANDLELAIADLRDMERRRSELIHQAVHDLRGNVQSVQDAAILLTSAQTAQPLREEFAAILQDGVSSVSGMLGDLMELARLEAGRESMILAPFDAAHLVAELCKVKHGQATAAGLYLDFEGVDTLPVEGDANKVRRTLQNLLINALKYTRQGGVTVTWGAEAQHWWVKVRDTGPGLIGTSGAPFARELMQATRDARKIDLRAATAEGRDSPILDPQSIGSAQPPPGRGAPGEGVGLSIIKRLCELLDARLELISSGNDGTTFRVVFPRAYPLHRPR